VRTHSLRPTAHAHAQTTVGQGPRGCRHQLPYGALVTNNSQPIDVRRQAGWFPHQQSDLEAWLIGHRKKVNAGGGDRPLHPVLVEFEQLMAADPILRMHLNEMITQVPKGRQYSQRHIDDVDELLRLINAVLTMAPEFGDQNVTLPLAAILDWTMATSAGFAAYRDPRLNAMLKDVLTVWSEFLSSDASLYVLDESPTGWKSPAAKRAVGMDQYQHDPQQQFWGFTSWNDFFTRRFKDGQRPVHSPDDDNVIVAACESTPYAIAVDVQLEDSFWLKSQPYSLRDMFAGDPACGEFVGGTVYQAFLSAVNYHRWHSPVAGTIVRAFVQPGTYYSEADSEGADATDPIDSQGYIAHVATRAIIIIQADNPAIGLVGFIAIGMAEVSSCLIDPHMTSGHHVAKGEELGYFQFGGSTHCLVFQPGAIADFSLSAIPQTNDPHPPLVQVRSKLALAAQHR
jgi:phosphatidylserine decarboxylase